jgi:hypothetical protein
VRRPLRTCNIFVIPTSENEVLLVSVVSVGAAAVVAASRSLGDGFAFAAPPLAPPLDFAANKRADGHAEAFQVCASRDVTTQILHPLCIPNKKRGLCRPPALLSMDSTRSPELYL